MSTMRAVYTNVKAARTAIKDMARVRAIAAVLVRHGLGHVVEAWNIQDKAILGLLVEKKDPENAPLTVFERVAAALQELGPTFVKLGQILSTRPDLIPQALCDQLKSLQDQVREISLEEARAVVERALEQPIEAVFDDFSPTPLASASIAQVHTATLKEGGAEVVLKIQRPGIRRTIESDLNILYFLAKRVEATIPEAQAFDPVSIAREFEKAISKELDFNFEANNLERFDRNFSDWPQIYIPTVYREHSSRRLLVMERLHATKVTDAGAEGHDMATIASDLVSMVFKMVFEDGFFHGDLHPGNLLILRDGRIGLIDFGLVGRMSQRMKDAMADMLLHIATRNHEGTARALYEISLRRGKVDYDAFEDEVIEKMELHFTRGSLADVDFGAVLRDLIEGSIRHRVTIPPDYTMFFKAIMTVEGIGKIIAPDLDLLAEIQPHAERVVAARYSPERVMRASVDTLQSFARFARQFPITANQFLESIEDGRLAIGIEYSQLKRLEGSRDRRSNRGILAAGVATLLVCGTLARGDAGATLFGLPAITTLTYGLGGYLGMRLLWRIMRSGKW